MQKDGMPEARPVRYEVAPSDNPSESNDRVAVPMLVLDHNAHNYDRGKLARLARMDRQTLKSRVIRLNALRRSTARPG